MKNILLYIRNYLQHSDKKTFIGSSIFCAGLIFLNYHFHLDQHIGKNNFFPVKLIAWVLVFTVALGIPVLIQRVLTRHRPSLSTSFYGIFTFSVLLFSLKYNLRFQFPFSVEQAGHQYWNKIIFWPALLLLMLVCLFAIRKWMIKEETAWGTRVGVHHWRPYLLMLLMMIPLVALASMQPDFQDLYPKLKLLVPEGQISEIPAWQVFLFELAYGTDFLTIELFFRGFLILGLARWLGKDAILPVAIFYCSIHFGKPLGECISSYFGGLLLGIIVYNTRSIWGGLLVHVGIAWMMELAGAVVSR